MNKKIFSLIVTTALFVAVLTSCNKKEDDPKSTPSETRIDDLVASLSKYDELSEFVSLLKELYVDDIKEEGFTVFPINNDGMSGSIGEGINLKRHIVAGMYPKSSLTHGQQMLALDGTVLKIIIMGDRVYVNGMELGDEMQADNNVAYIVKKPITAAFNSAQYSFSVSECNTAWSFDNNVPYLAASKASVSLRDSLGRAVGLYTTGADGKLTITLVKGRYFYKVTKDNFSNISKNGYTIAGIFTTQEEIDIWGSRYPTESPAVLGGLMFVDYNGDMRINNDDKPLDGFTHLWPHSDVYIATANFTPTYIP